ncbi:VOC family protein [Nocardia sp. NBC_01329]|uniref:VOC family protein n=1 Tax=Nocardia sp. NBC_01329 TaxID=2903594 RepID=UPI002E12B32A|nr:hypothetical protein OG405_14390 [Nocardia sp. NBC_01329]
MPNTATELAGVRYLVDNVAAAIEFYTTHLGFTVAHDYSPAFADVTRGPLRPLPAGSRAAEHLEPWPAL